MVLELLLHPHTNNGALLLGLTLTHLVTLPPLLHHFSLLLLLLEQFPHSNSMAACGDQPVILALRSHPMHVIDLVADVLVFEGVEIRLVGLELMIVVILLPLL